MIPRKSEKSQTPLISSRSEATERTKELAVRSTQSSSPRICKTQPSKSFRVVISDELTLKDPLLLCSTSNEKELLDMPTAREIYRKDGTSDDSKLSNASLQTIRTTSYSDEGPANAERTNNSNSSSFRNFMVSLSSRFGKHRPHRYHDSKQRYKLTEQYIPKSRRSLKEAQLDDQEFLDRLEKFKHKQFMLDCSCGKPLWVHRIAALWNSFVNSFRFLWRLLWCTCFPPCPSSLLSKIAFWPPPREYFFFENKNPGMKGAEAAQKANIKVRRATRKYASKKDWRFGMEHKCAAEVTGVECFIVKTKAKNHIAGVFVRKQRPRYTLLFSHPNANDISDHLVGLPNLFDAARYHNCNVCSYDYSGYGISEGRPNEKNLYGDINAIYEYLLNELYIAEGSIVLWGYSIGATASVDLALRASNVAGLILFSPPASILNVLCCSRRSEPYDCSYDKFSTFRKIMRIKIPTLIVHGAQDTMVTIEHAQAIYRRCPGAVPPLWIPDVGHNNLEHSAELWRRMRTFLRKEARPPPSANFCTKSGGIDDL